MPAGPAGLLLGAPQGQKQNTQKANGGSVVRSNVAASSLNRGDLNLCLGESVSLLLPDEEPGRRVSFSAFQLNDALRRALLMQLIWVH